MTSSGLVADGSYGASPVCVSVSSLWCLACVLPTRLLLLLMECLMVRSVVTVDDGNYRTVAVHCVVHYGRVNWSVM